ncbi:Uncharacterised protein [Sarcina ventriculi]|uniref:NADH dehydrogenase subunit 6 n=1 Tax=Sarcina ventriculi TaxID=1267 RepID=A0ABP2ASH5_SARVE|nr:Uncharacterised protein [Sarcina ventriculi]
MNILKALRIDYRLNKIHFIHLCEYGLYKFNKSYFSITKSTPVDTYISLDILLFLIFLFIFSFLDVSFIVSFTVLMISLKVLKLLSFTVLFTVSVIVSFTVSVLNIELYE